MKRKHLSVILSIVFTFAIAGCGGGGGGGVTPIEPSITLTGMVLDLEGNAVVGAGVSVTSQTGFSRSGSTNSSGVYNLSGIPVGVDLTIVVTKNDLINRTFTGVRFEGDSPRMDVVINAELVPAGSTVHTLPEYLTRIYQEDPQWFSIEMRDSHGNRIDTQQSSGWMPNVVVTGGLGELSQDPRFFRVTGINVGDEITVTVMVPRTDGTVASETRDFIVSTIQMPPDPPPLNN